MTWMRRPLALLCFSCAVVASQPNNNTNGTTAPPTASLRATYRGRFQLLVDGCEGPPPVVQAACAGDTIRLINVSHPEIVCTPSQEDLPAGFHSGLTCSTTCNTTECADKVYRNDGSYLPAEAPRGAITYQCDGDSKQRIDSVFSYINTGNATCEEWRWFFDNQVFRMAQLGILCDMDAMSYDQVALMEEKVVVFDNNQTGTEHVIPRNTLFVFSANYFECSQGNSIDFKAPPYLNAVLCAEGRNCGRDECEVEFDTLQVYTDISQVGGRCIEYLGGSILDLDDQVDYSMPEGNYSMQFQVQFTLLMKNPGFWYNVQDLECVLFAHIEVALNCTNGVIELLDVSHPELFYCYGVDDGLLNCVIPVSEMTMLGDEAFLNSFFSVNYECTATDQLPTTEATAQRNSMACFEDIYDELVLGPALQLGHFCQPTPSFQDQPIVLSAQDSSSRSNSGPGEFDFGDYHHKCGSNDQFSFLDDETNYPGDRLTCFDVVPLRYQNTIAMLPRVSMRTDWRMENGGLDPLCYHYAEGPSATGNGDMVSSGETP